MAKCKHRETKEVITAKEVEIHCTNKECKEIIATRKRVLSSNVFSIGRIGKETFVQFMAAGGPGGTYQVSGMSEADYQEMMHAKSKGQHYSEFVKKNSKYKITKVN